MTLDRGSATSWYTGVVRYKQDGKVNEGASKVLRSCVGTVNKKGHARIISILIQEKKIKRNIPQLDPIESPSQEVGSTDLYFVPAASSLSAASSFYTLARSHFFLSFIHRSTTPSSPLLNKMNPYVSSRALLCGPVYSETSNRKFTNSVKMKLN